MVGTLKPSIEMLLLRSLPLLPVRYISTICDHRSFFHHRWWGPYKALLWLCEWNLGEQRGKRAKGEQTGSLNRVFFTDSRPFSRIRGLFGDSGPFPGFGAFFGDWGPFSEIHSLFWGFAAFSQIRGFTAMGAKGAKEPPGETFAT